MTNLTVAEFEFIDLVRRKLSPLNIVIDIKQVGYEYFIIVDGSRTYKDTALWEKYWICGFEGFSKRFIYPHIGKVDTTMISDTCIEFKIGTLMDIIKGMKNE